jgi:hypothetical protein
MLHAVPKGSNAPHSLVLLTEFVLGDALRLFLTAAGMTHYLLKRDM